MLRPVHGQRPHPTANLQDSAVCVLAIGKDSPEFPRGVVQRAVPSVKRLVNPVEELFAAQPVVRLVRVAYIVAGLAVHATVSHRLRRPPTLHRIAHELPPSPEPIPDHQRRCSYQKHRRKEHFSDQILFQDPPKLETTPSPSRQLESPPSAGKNGDAAPRFEKAPLQWPAAYTDGIRPKQQNLPIGTHEAQVRTGRFD